METAIQGEAIWSSLLQVVYIRKRRAAPQFAILPLDKSLDLTYIGHTTLDLKLGHKTKCRSGPAIFMPCVRSLIYKFGTLSLRYRLSLKQPALNITNVSTKQHLRKPNHRALVSRARIWDHWRTKTTQKPVCKQTPLQQRLYLVLHGLPIEEFLGLMGIIEWGAKESTSGRGHVRRKPDNEAIAREVFWASKLTIGCWVFSFQV